MSKISGTVRRLHPKLRVVRNGSADVNSCRAEISTTVYAATAPGPTDTSREEISTGLDMAAAQRSIRTLETNTEIDSSQITGGGLSKRAKLKDQKAADSVFVNVCIEVNPSGANDFEALQAVEDIIAICEAKLAESAVVDIPGAVICRQNLVTATVPISFLSELEENENVAFVQPAEALKLDVPVGRKAKRPTRRRVGRSKSHNNGKDILIGIIDVGGFDFAHPDFLNRDKINTTRFVAIWDQGGDFRAPPEKFGYGSEFTHDKLNAALKAQAEPGGLPATMLERQSQMREGSHGTHVASIAAGNKGVCPMAEIAAVLIDVPTPLDERERRKFTFSDSSRITHAIEYLLAIAADRKKPISINISLGTNGGAHDGSSAVARWMDMALSTSGRSICLAAGNAGQEKARREGDLGWIMGRIHSSGKIAARELSHELGWVVIGNGRADISENELEIWYSAQDRFRVELLPPGSSRWLKVSPQEFIENKRLSDGTTVSIYNELYSPANGINSISIYLSPNLEPGNIRGIRAGVWRVRLIGEEIRNGEFHCWIERDDPEEIGQIDGERLFRFPSFFSEQSNVDSHSISSLACGDATISVANYNEGSNKINITSSQGPTRDGRLKPDIAATGTDIVAAKGFSTDTEKWISMSGTSMASPYVAGVIGLLLNTDKNLNAAQCLGILQRTAKPLPGKTFEWSNDAGFGRISSEDAIREAATFLQRTELS